MAASAVAPTPALKQHAPLRLFLASPPASRGQRWLDRLARWLDLDVFGDSLLSRRARGDMRIQAVLLAIVFVFDLSVWSLIGNLLFGAGLELGWYTLPAVLLGLLTAMVVFAWERSFAIFDSRSGWTLWRGAGLLLRLGLIVAAAFATAKPFELIVFWTPIRQRVYDEWVRQEVVVRQVAIGALNRDIEALRTRRSSIPASVEGSDANVIAATAELKQQVRLLDGRIVALYRKVGEAEEDPEGGKARAASLLREIESLEKRRDSLLKQIADYVFKRVEQTRKEQHQLFEQIDGQITSKQRELRGIEDGLAQIQSQKNLVSGATSLPDVFRQLRIVEDLVAGAPPRWPQTDPATLRSLKARYSLEDAPVPETGTYEILHRLALIVGLTIPLMTLAFKFLMSSPDLTQYYSMRDQAASGNPEALRHVMARRRSAAQSL